MSKALSNEMRFIQDSLRLLSSLPSTPFRWRPFCGPVSSSTILFYLFHEHLSRPGHWTVTKCALDYRKLAWLNSVGALLRLDELTYTVVRTQSGWHDNKYGIVESRQIGLSFGLKARQKIPVIQYCFSVILSRKYPTEVVARFVVLI